MGRLRDLVSRMRRPSPRRAAADRPMPIVRKMKFDFDAVPRHWFFDSAYVTHVANGLHLVFPAGERFFIRSVRYYLDRIDDPTLRARVRAFFGQEGAHGHQHELSFRILERQGFEVQRFLDDYERAAFGRLEPSLPPILRLSVTVALEHFTATLAKQGLTTDLLTHAHPSMEALLKWHAAEEIEHKSVAFDVLYHVQDGETARYVVRLAGLVIAILGLLYFWRRAAVMLLAQDGTPRAALKDEKVAARARGQNNAFLLHAIASYLRPGFHPDDDDDYHLARDYLASVSATRLAS